MPSSLTWLSHDSSERDRTLALFELFKDEGTIDELGVGAIRDTFSDALFPGTSVIQTRARYLLFVPWLLTMTVEESRGGAIDPDRLRARELRLITSLLAGGEVEGVIGREARERLKRMPSQVYWAALGRYRIRTTDVTIARFFRDAGSDAERRRHLPDAGDDGLVARAPVPGLDPALATACRAPSGLLSATTFTLTPDEASYLRDRIVGATSGSLMALLLARELRDDAALVWHHAHRAAFPSGLVLVVDHARRFHHAIYGALLLYNLLLAERKGAGQLVEAYRRRLLDWEREMAENRVLADWSRPSLWATILARRPTLRTGTRLFVDTWLDGLVKATAVADDASLRLLIARREKDLKGNRARLVNQAALDSWGGESGLGRLDYRWGVARRLLDDVFDGLGVTP